MMTHSKQQVAPAEEVRRKASRHILHKLGDRLWAGEPAYDEHPEQWTAPIHSRSLPADVVLGQITMDAHGDVVRAPSRHALQRAVEEHQYDISGKRKWLLIMALAEYQDADGSMVKRGAKYLPGVRKDAERLKTVLKKFADGPIVEIIELPNAKATQTGILEAVHKVASQAYHSDQVIFYFGGHGHWAMGGDSPVSDGATRYLLPYEATFNTAAQHGISTGMLAKALSEVRAEEIVAIFDCCYSSGQARALWPMAPMLTERNCYVIASAEQEALESDKGGFLLQPLCGALQGVELQPSAEGRISIQMAFAYAAPHAEAEAREAAQKYKLPIVQEAIHGGVCPTIYLTNGARRREDSRRIIRAPGPVFLGSSVRDRANEHTRQDKQESLAESSSYAAAFSDEQSDGRWV